MAFLVSEDNVRFIGNSDSIKIKDRIPAGVYKTAVDPFRGTYLEKTEIKLSHGKIYGEAQNIANHIVESFKKNDSTKNLGVLFSGYKGLGKTLTTRLVIEQLVKNYPIITISKYSADLPDLLENVKGCVILMDEFEKFMGGSASGNPLNSDSESEQTKQERILSILDGNTGCTGNLFLLTVNDLFRVDENLKGRPGRIRYHYKFTSEKADVVRNYCIDNLKNQENIEEVVKCLGETQLVSMDILTSFVEELNAFPNKTPAEVIKYFNIEASDEDSNYLFTARVLWKGKEFIYQDRAPLHYYYDGRWMTIRYKNPKDRDELQKKGIPEHLRLSIYEDADIRSFGTTDLILGSDYEVEEETFNQNDNFAEEDFKILSFTVKDVDADRRMRNYNLTLGR